MPDFAKTQFLFEGHGVKQFRRKRTTALIRRDGTLIRECSHKDWLKLKADWPNEVADDGLKLVVIWKLVETNR